jgi:hypothetical protein
MEGYVYKILFSDGCWYWGTSTYKDNAPEKDGYYGSPETHIAKWGTPHSKIVLRVFGEEQARLDYEEMCIRPDLNNPRCLNEHAGRAFSREVCRAGGRRSAEKSRGVPRTPEVKDKISKKNKGRKLTPEHIQKLKEAERPPVTPEATKKGIESRKGYRHSEKTKQKIGSGNKGKKRPQELRDRIAETIKGFEWYNNGKENVQAREHPGEGWEKGRILAWETPRNKGMKWYHREGMHKMFLEDPGDGWEQGMTRPKGKKYYNNGTDHVLAYESPGLNWVPGRLSKK